MRSIVIFILTTLIYSTVNAQAHLTTPLEILSFMEASPTQYEIEQLYGDIPHKNHTIIPHGAYIEVINDKEYQRNYKDNESLEESSWRTKARELTNVENPNYKKARNYYHKILKKNPQNAQIHTFIGETYYEQKNYTEALEWFKKAIDLNPIDYLARWLSAEIFLQYGQTDTAIYAITLAHIYNRNHPRLLKRLIEVYNQHHKIYYRNWSFRPKTYVYKDGERVVVTADGIWLTYGMYKAVWNFDPDYQYIKDQQEVTDYIFHQELEATIGTYMTYSALKRDDRRNYPSMNALGYCLDNEMVEEFVMYEILLVNTPTVSYHITPKFMQRLFNYIATIRSIDHINDNK